MKRVCREVYVIRGEVLEGNRHERYEDAVGVIRELGREGEAYRIEKQYEIAVEWDVEPCRKVGGSR